MNAEQIISTLKGKPITIFLMMCALGGQSGVKQLADKTGYSQPTISAGLQLLKVHELATKTGRYNSWTLTTTGLQLSMNLMLGDKKSLPRSKNILSPPISNSNDSNLIESSKDINTTNSETEIKKVNLEVHTLLKEARIGEPKCTDLALMDHVTLEYAKAHLESGEDLALIIWKMERNHDAPELRTGPDFMPCRECGIYILVFNPGDNLCDDCSADMVEH